MLGFFAGGLPFWVLATTPSLPVAVAALFLSGLASGPLNPILMTIRQERIPSNLRGRVFGAYIAIAHVAMPIGFFLGGVVIDRFGVETMLLAMSGAYLVTTIWLVFSPTFRTMDRAA